MFNMPSNTAAQGQSPKRPANIDAATIINTTESPAQIAKHREIARHYTRPRRKRDRPNIVSLTLGDLQTFYSDRYGDTFPDDDAGREDLTVLLRYIAQLGDPRAMAACAAYRCPWLSEAEYTAMIDGIERRPRRWRADSLAREIGLNRATRTRLAITTIGAIDFCKANRTKRRRKNNNAGKLAVRAAAGAKPHAMSAERLKPWLDHGISKATWNRRRKLAREAREADSGTAAYLFRGDNSASQAVQGASAQADLTRSATNAAPNAADLESQSLATVMDQSMRDTAFADRLGFNWIKKGLKPVENLPLQTPASRYVLAAA
jgi:hypothetical protein